MKSRAKIAMPQDPTTRDPFQDSSCRQSDGEMKFVFLAFLGVVGALLCPHGATREKI